jgi:Recombination, repair and ssDNA binding protein UvsY
MSKYVAPNLDELIAEWEIDAKVDTTNPGGEMIRIPIIHSKYNKYLSLHKVSLVRREAEFDKLRKTKWMYYNGKLSQSELAALGWEPFPFTLKTDLNIYMDADEDIVKAKATIAIHDECVSFCTYVMKELGSRTYQIKAWMEWIRFESGN